MTEEVKENAKPLKEIAMDFLKESHGLISARPTDFKDLDAINGLRKNDLILLAARPGAGKTALALNIAINTAKREKTVLFFSLEMTEQDLVRRVLSLEAEINQNRLLHKIDIPLFIDDSSGLYIFDLISKCRIFKRKHNNNLDFVVVDYLQLMKIGKGNNSENMEVCIAENLRMLKVLAEELQIPVLVLSQFSNRSKDEPPKLSNLRYYSYADTIWFIHHPIKKKSEVKEFAA